MKRCLLMAAVTALLAGCTDDEPHRVDAGPGKDTGGADMAQGTSEQWVNEDLLSSYELTLLVGRCIGRASLNDKTAPARAALLAIGKALAATIPVDGTGPTTVAELKALVPGSGAIADWVEDPSDTVKGPWSGTDVFAWINGGGKPFDDNGFKAVAGEGYVHNTNSSWELDLELVMMSSVDGAEKAFRAAQWDQGKQP